jgi:hypothetical protein
MTKAFKTVLRRARFEVTGYTPEQMARVGESLLRDSIIRRIRLGMDANDQPAPALKPRYRDRKLKKGLDAIRNWVYSGKTLRSLRVLTAATNQAKLGFTDAQANLRAMFNNRKRRQFAVSPTDRAKFIDLLGSEDGPITKRITNG